MGRPWRKHKAKKMMIIETINVSIKPSRVIRRGRNREDSSFWKRLTMNKKSFIMTDNLNSNRHRVTEQGQS